MDQNPSSSNKVDRKTIEKNRRNQMKDLFTSLNSLVQHDGSSQKMGSTSDQLERATDYIKKLQINLEKMKQKKKCLMEGAATKRPISPRSELSEKLPKMDIHIMGTAIEVVLKSDRNCQFMFDEIIRIVHEEGAEVVNASFSVTDEAVFHIIHLKIGEFAPENEAARITEILRKFMHGADRSMNVN